MLSLLGNAEKAFFLGTMYNAITDVPGIKVGHYTDKKAVTGCTVILCETGAVAGVDVRGSAPGTRETDLLRPMNLVEKVHAILLSGGSAFGLDAAGGVMRYLEERDIGYETLAAKVPIVPAAILFDLDIGSPKIRPGAEEGYKACLAATEKKVAEGCVGAGTGATVGKILGIERATKSGLGPASCKIGNDLIVAALVVVNAIGDVIDPKTGGALAGPRGQDNKCFLNTVELLTGGTYSYKLNSLPTNTTLGVVATNASLNKEQVNKLAQMAQDGLARAINPSHTMYDGDTIFALSLGDKIGDITILGAAAAEMVANAIIRAIQHAETLAEIPAIKDMR
ncbi:MAG: P1 family peptidase [Dehalococcoidia bacterium]|nr:P1 family peptidase [Dehalococcoidia bacterium]